MSELRSHVWGNRPQRVSQKFGVNLPNVPDQWYAYAADWGFAFGTHVGVDVSMERNTPIFAAADGTVVKEGPDLNSFRPNPVTIETPDDPATPDDEREHHIYGHLWSDVVSPGQRVRRGELIGYSGEQTRRGTWTPDGSGPHLHFERRDISESRALDPLPLLNGSTSGVVGGGPVRVSAGAIDRRISKSEAANGSRSPIAGMGSTIVALGERYGVNPAVVTAVMQRECQLGAATNDVLIPLNNFGGNTAIPGSVEGTAGVAYRLDRHWQVNRTPQDGIEGIFKTLNHRNYRNVGPRLEDIMRRYAPPHENDWPAMWTNFAATGRDLGVDISPDTDVYSLDSSGGGGSGSGGGGLLDWSGMASHIADATAEGARRAAVGLLGLAILAIGVIALIGPDRLAEGITAALPTGRVAKLATGGRRR